MMPAIFGRISALCCRIPACAGQAVWGESSGGAEKFAVPGADERRDLAGGSNSDSGQSPRARGATTCDAPK
jgi:hypothetical protein